MASKTFNSFEAEYLLSEFCSTSEIINDNRELIECRMRPQFKCKLCNVSIEYSEDKSVMLSNFTAHFSLPNHESHVSVMNQFKALSLNGDCPPDLIDSLIDSMPKPFVDIEYIVENGKGQIRCLICNCILPATTNNLIEHLQGINHQANRKNHHHPSSKEPRSNLNFDEIFLKLVETDQLIAKNSKLFFKYSDKFYVCILCGALIQGCNKMQVFRNNFHFHIGAIEHKRKLTNWKKWSEMSLAADSDTQLSNLFKMLPPKHQHNIEYIKGPASDRMLFCSVCSVFINSPSLISHLKGAFHLFSKNRYKLMKHDCKNMPDMKNYLA